MHAHYDPNANASTLVQEDDLQLEEAAFTAPIPAKDKKALQAAAKKGLKGGAGNTKVSGLRAPQRRQKRLRVEKVEDPQVAGESDSEAVSPAPTRGKRALRGQP